MQWELKSQTYFHVKYIMNYHCENWQQSVEERVSGALDFLSQSSHNPPEICHPLHTKAHRNRVTVERVSMGFHIHDVAVLHPVCPSQLTLAKTACYTVRAMPLYHYHVWNEIPGMRHGLQMACATPCGTCGIVQSQYKSGVAEPVSG